MKRVLVSHAGGRIGLGFSRCLRRSPEAFHVIGVDSSEFHLMRAVADERHLVPQASDPAFLPVLRQIVRDTRPDLVWVQHEAEIALLARTEHIGAPTFLPSSQMVDICQNKMASFSMWQKASVPVPASMMLYDASDLDRAFQRLGDTIWLRSVKGAGGRGSLPASDVDTAKRWIDFHRGWGTFMAAEYLPGRMLAWDSIWADGQLIAAQCRVRLNYELSNLTMSGVTGITGAEHFIGDPDIDALGIQTLQAIDRKPHGAFSVDMTSDAAGQPKVTEVNVGRFGSAGNIHYCTPEFNLPYFAVLAGLGRRPKGTLPLMNLLPQNIYLVHGLDMEPVVAPMEQVDRLLGSLINRAEKTKVHAT